MKINKVLFTILAPIYHWQIEIDDKKLSNARDFLNSLSADPDNSCLTNNVIKPLYDLQVIIPAYNTADTIEKCIDSVLKQKTNYKYIVTVVNDGSPDNMNEVLNKYNKLDKVEIITQINQGFSGARNRGLCPIKGRFLTFLDSDDELNGDRAIELLMHTVENKRADICQGGYIMFKKSKDICRFQPQSAETTNANSVLYGFPWGKVFKSSLFERVCFPDGYWFEDTIGCFILYPLCKKAVVISDIVYRYRLNPNGISATCMRSDKVLDSYWITERLLKDRVMLGLSCDEHFANIMLSQIKMNYRRICSRGNKDIDMAVFVLTVGLWNKYFVGIDHSSFLARALKANDFYAYRLACELG